MWACTPVHQGLAGRVVLESLQVEQLPVGGLDLAPHVRGDLGQKVAGTVDQTPLPKTAGQGALDGAEQPGRPVADYQQGRAQPEAVSSSRKSAHASLLSLPAVDS